MNVSYTHFPPNGDKVKAWAMVEFADMYLGLLGEPRSTARDAALTSLETLFSGAWSEWCHEHSWDESGEHSSFWDFGNLIPCMKCGISHYVRHEYADLHENGNHKMCKVRA